MPILSPMLHVSRASRTVTRRRRTRQRAGSTDRPWVVLTCEDPRPRFRCSRARHHPRPARGGRGARDLAAPGNAGIAQDATIVTLDANDAAVTQYAIENAIDLVVVGPEAPLVAGVADAAARTRHPGLRPRQGGRAARGLEGLREAHHGRPGRTDRRGLRPRTLAEVEAALDESARRTSSRPTASPQARASSSPTTRRRRSPTPTRICPPARCWSRRPSPGPRSPSSSSATGTPCCAFSPAQDFERLGNGDAGPTRAASAPTPAALARPSCPCRIVRGRIHQSERLRRPRHSQAALPVIRQSRCRGHALHRTALRGPHSSRRRRQGRRARRALRRPRDPTCCPASVEPLSRPCCSPRPPGILEDLPGPAFSDDAAITVVLAIEGTPRLRITGRPIEGLDAASAVEGVRIAHAATARRRGRAGRDRRPRAQRRRRGHRPSPARDRAYRALGEIGLEAAASGPISRRASRTGGPRRLTLSPPPARTRPARALGGTPRRPENRCRPAGPK